MNFLITGSTGFLGNHLSKYLLCRGHNVIKCTRKKNTNKELHFDLINGFEIDHADKIILKKVDVLIHCAFDFSCKSYQSHKNVNFEGSRKVFELAKIFNIKILYISSISAFQNSVSLYGKMKFITERLAKKYNSTIIRPGLIYSDNSKGIFGLIEKVIINFPIIPLIGLGKQKLYTCNIENLCMLIDFLSKNHKNENNIITAASKKYLFFRDMIKIIARKNNKKILAVPIPLMIIYFFLHLNSFFNIIKRFQPDNLRSLINSNDNPSFVELDKTKIIFPEFEKDY